MFSVYVVFFFNTSLGNQRTGSGSGMVISSSALPGVWVQRQEIALF